MLSVAVYNMQGERTGELEIDAAALGGVVRPRLLKQAIVAYLDHQRQRSVRTKGRGQVDGSTRKLYRQKGTGRARAGNARTPVRRGGGRTFARRVPAAVKAFPKKMRRLARANAVLAKIEADQAVIVDGLSCSEPKTKTMAAMLAALDVRKGCVLALDEPDRNVYLSGRNLPNADIRLVAELTAYEILARDKLIFTKPAFERMASGGLWGAPADVAGEG